MTWLFCLLFKQVFRVYSSQFIQRLNKHKLINGKLCVCLCVFTSIHREGFLCLGLEFQGTDQRCCIEDITSLCLVP